MHQQMSKSAKINQLATVADGAAATTDINSASVDNSGFEGVLFLVAFGAITAGAVTSIKLQQSDDDGASDGWSDIADSAQTIADSDDNKTFYIDLYRPQKRYTRMVVDRGTQNAVVGAINAFQYPCHKQPTTHGTSVSGETHVAPAEGTA